MSLYATPPFAKMDPDERNRRHAQLMYLIGIGDPGLPTGPVIDPRIAFWAPLTNSLIPTTAGNPTFTFARGSLAYAMDNEGILRQSIANEARFQGARRVRNYIVGSSQNFSTWVNGGVAITYGVMGPTGQLDANTTTGAGYAYGPCNLPDGLMGVTSLWMRRRTGIGAVILRNAANIRIDVSASLSGTWKRISTPPVISATGGAFAIDVDVPGDQIDIAYAQIEDVSGQSNQAPSEYVSVGTLPIPYHGNAIDGCRYFGTTNGNSVPSNLLLWSEDFSNAAWGRLGLASVTAQRITEDTANSRHICYQSLLPSVTKYAFSCFAKAGTRDRIILKVDDVPSHSAIFNLVTGTVGNSANCVASIISVGGGAYRCAIVFTRTTGGGGAAHHVGLALNDTFDGGFESTYLGTGAYADVWGAQVEQNGVVGPYVPTTTTAVAGNIVTEATGTAIPLATTLGYVAENAATNVCTQSQAFENAAWTKDGTTPTADSTVAPDGTLTADTLTNTAVNMEHRVFQVVSEFGLSVYAKAGTASFLGLSTNGLAAQSAQFNLSLGTVLAVAGGTATITALPNGWYRCAYRASAGGYCIINYGETQAQAVAGTLYVGTLKTIILWGAQVEQASDPSSYIPTTTGPVSRAADALSYAMVSNLDGTLATTYTECYLPTSSPADQQVALQTTTVPFYPQYYAAAPKNFGNYNGAIVLTANNRVQNALNKGATAWSGATVSAVLNGGVVGTGAFTAYANSGNIVIGGSGAGTGQLRGTIRNVKFYATRLTDAELVTLTSPDPTPPAIPSTPAAGSITPTGATLSGTATSNGAATTVNFEYGLTTAYGSIIAALQSPLAANAVAAAVSAVISGLIASTLYHFRVVATNSKGTTNGSDQTFTTSASDPLFSSVQLLLHGDGANNGTVFTDSSSFALTPTVTGGIVTATDAQAFGGSSIRCFTGSANYMTYSGRTFAGAGEAFTLEFWMRINNGVGNGSGYAAGYAEFVNLSGGGTLCFSANGLVGYGVSHQFANQSLVIADFSVATVNDRVFVMFCRDAAGATSLYYNGRYAVTFGSFPGAIDTIIIGNRRLTSAETGAFVEEVRFTRGVERQLRGSLSYAQVAFTPPTAAFPNG